MLLIDNDTVRRVLTMADCMAVQEEAFAAAANGTAVSRPRIDTFVPCEREDGYYRFGSIEGTSHEIYAVRLKSDIMTWPRGPDGSSSEQKYCVRPGTYCGLVLLFSTRDGAPLAILNDGHLQHMRVGGAAGIGTKLLARPDAESVCVIGSGGMARTALEAILLVRPIRQVRVYSRDPGRRAAFAEETRNLYDVDAVAVSSAETAVEGADIVATCTDSMSQVIDGAWLRPGMHVVNIGPSDIGPDSESRIDCVIRQGSEVLPIPESDSYVSGLGHSRGGFIAGTPQERSRVPRSKHKKAAAREWPTYADVISGRAPGRTTGEQITQYRPVGNWGLQFSSVGGLVYRNAKRLGVGRELPTELFLQDVKN